MAINLNVNGGYHPPLRVGSMEKTLQATPESAPGSSQSKQVDTIAALRAAIADGSYKVDSQRLAGKIIDLESQLA
ncbi:MAG: flagellar biosynthesis anti-sigma factor FlgM [Synechococcaceae cyanobacterium SM1_2_3]|nr:flagellar biosynthesis anti-sigma factor FlgM [Synechococcaceae cyanobacterium SM1_2_3]